MATALLESACLWLELVGHSRFASVQSLLWQLDLLSAEHMLSGVLRLGCCLPVNIVAASKKL
jgi:hypothetical protein